MPLFYITCAILFIPSKMVSVSIMPCTAKKFEADRPEMRSSGFKDVDYVLTTRELAIMIKQAGIDFRLLEPSSYDSIMGDSTGAVLEARRDEGPAGHDAAMVLLRVQGNREGRVAHNSSRVARRGEREAGEARSVCAL